jgi:hypothetical protein
MPNTSSAFSPTKRRNRNKRKSRICRRIVGARKNEIPFSPEQEVGTGRHEQWNRCFSVRGCLARDRKPGRATRALNVPTLAQTIHPIEIDTIGTYDSSRDERMIREETFRFAIGRALDLACPGAPALMDAKRVGFPQEKDR